MKTCRKCGLEKPYTEFYRRRTEPDGYARTCRACGAAKAKRDNGRRAHRKRTDPEFAERVKAYSRNYRRRVKSEYYGVDVAALEAAQDGRCAACRRTPDEVACQGRSGEVLHVDHDHACCSERPACGKCVRGLLCKKCNSILAMADDDVHRLYALIDYLTRYQEAAA